MLRRKTALYIAIILLSVLACGEEIEPTSTATLSTATPASEVATSDDTNNEGEVVDAEEVIESSEDAEESVDEAPEPTDEPTAEPTPEPTLEPTEVPVSPMLGDAAIQDGYFIMALQVEDPAPSGLFYTEVEGMKLVAVEVIVGNIDGDVHGTNVLNFNLLDADGFVYDAELGGRDGQIALVNLLAGEQVRGWVSFTIPEEATPASIKYSISLFGDDVIRTGVTVGDNDPIPTPALNREAVGQLGDLVERDGYSLSAVTVSDPATPGTFYEPVEGYKLVAVEIVVGNVDEETFTTNVLNVYLIDTNGFVYAAELGACECEQLDLADLAPGERVKGWASFIIPNDAQVESIRYEFNSFDLIFLQVGLVE